MQWIRSEKCSHVNAPKLTSRTWGWLSIHLSMHLWQGQWLYITSEHAHGCHRALTLLCMSTNTQITDYLLNPTTCPFLCAAPPLLQTFQGAPSIYHLCLRALRSSSHITNWQLCRGTKLKYDILNKLFFTSITYFTSFLDIIRHAAHWIITSNASVRNSWLWETNNG